MFTTTPIFPLRRVEDVQPDRFLTELSGDYFDNALLVDGAYVPSVESDVVPEVTIEQAETWS